MNQSAWFTAPQHLDEAFRVAALLLGESESPLPAIQDAFVQLGKRPEANDPLRGRQFFFAALLRRCRRIKKHPHRLLLPPSEEGGKSDDQQFSPEVLRQKWETLPDPSFAALVFFYATDLPLEGIARITGLSVADLASELNLARAHLAPSFHFARNSADLPRPRPGSSSSRELPGDKSHALDRALIQSALSIQPGPDHTASLQSWARQAEEASRHHGFSFRDPAVLAVTLAFLLMLAFLIWQFLGNLGKIEGEDELFALISEGASSAEQEFEPVVSPLAGLDDWFVMNGVDRFWVPNSFQSLEAVAARVFRFNGTYVGCAAIPNQQMLVYSFAPMALGINLPQDNQWHFAARGQEAAALIEKDGMIFVAVIRGELSELKSRLEKITANPTKLEPLDES